MEVINSQKPNGKKLQDKIKRNTLKTTNKNGTMYKVGTAIGQEIQWRELKAVI